MRAFAHLPSKRRVAGVIVFALMVFSALGAVHHHRLSAGSETVALTVPGEAESGRTADCFVCRTLVSARAFEPQVSAPHVVVTRCDDAPAVAPVLSSVYRPSAPRAPPAA
jgi:hypothetical protein